VTELCAAGEFERNALIDSAIRKVKGRICFNKSGDFAQVFELAIASRDY
jgi:hypothetical protein